MKDNENIHLKIVRLFSGQANEKEKEGISQWLNQSEDNRKLYDDLREIWVSSGVQNNSDHYDLDKAIQQFKNKLRQQKSVESTKIRLLRFCALCGNHYSNLIATFLLLVRDA